VEAKLISPQSISSIKTIKALPKEILHTFLSLQGKKQHINQESPLKINSDNKKTLHTYKQNDPR